LKENAPLTLIMLLITVLRIVVLKQSLQISEL
jgi:hypothetical protein